MVVYVGCLYFRGGIAKSANPDQTAFESELTLFDQIHPHLLIRVCYESYFSYFSTKTYNMGTQKHWPSAHYAVYALA